VETAQWRGSVMARVVWRMVRSVAALTLARRTPTSSRSRASTSWLCTARSTWSGYERGAAVADHVPHTTYPTLHHPPVPSSSSSAPPHYMSLHLTVLHWVTGLYRPTVPSLSLSVALYRSLSRSMARSALCYSQRSLQVAALSAAHCALYHSLRSLLLAALAALADTRARARRIARADLSGEIIASIICPGLIYGLGTGPDKIISALTPSMMSLAMKRGQVVVAGRGTNVWPDVGDFLVLSSCRPPVLPSSRPPVHPFTYPPVHLSTCPLVHSSTRPLVHSSTRPPVHPSTRPPVHTSTRPHFHPSRPILTPCVIRSTSRTSSTSSCSR
jgi:hypothetical protein